MGCFLSSMLFLNLNPQFPTARLENFYLSLREVSLESHILRETLCDDRVDQLPIITRLLQHDETFPILFLRSSLFDTLNYAMAREGHWILLKKNKNITKKVKRDPTLILTPSLKIFHH